MLEAKEFKGVLKKLKTCYQTDMHHYAKRKPVFIWFIKYVIQTIMKGGCFPLYPCIDRFMHCTLCMADVINQFSPQCVDM